MVVMHVANLNTCFLKPWKIGEATIQGSAMRDLGRELKSIVCNEV